LVLWLDSFFSKRRLITHVLHEQIRQGRIKAAAEQSATAQQKTHGETI
jgi:heme exporter protein D